MTTEQMREAFEAEMRCVETWGHQPLKRKKCGQYENWRVALMWNVWQAALTHPAPPASQEQAQQPMCKCGDRPAGECDEEWGPQCDLGNNPAHVKVAQQPSGGEVVAHVPVHPRSGPLWANVRPAGADTPVPSYPMRALTWADVTTPKPEPMTDDHVWHSDGIMSANGIAGFKMDALLRIVRAVEAHHGITKGEA